MASCLSCEKAYCELQLNERRMPRPTLIFAREVRVDEQAAESINHSINLFSFLVSVTQLGSTGDHERPNHCLRNV